MCGVEGEVSEEFSGGGVDDAYVEFVDQEDDGGSGVGSSDSDVVEPPVVPEGDFAAVVDLVDSDALMILGCCVGGCGFGAGVVDNGWCRTVG